MHRVPRTEVRHADRTSSQRRPTGPDDHRLDAPNLVLTPHAAWYSQEADDALYERIAEVAVTALRGETARGLIA